MTVKEAWDELRESITELRDNDGTLTQQEVCEFLVNLMDVLEEQMQEPRKAVTNAEEAENYPISEDISKSFEEFTKTMFKQEQVESEDKE